MQVYAWIVADWCESLTGRCRGRKPKPHMIGSTRREARITGWSPARAEPSDSDEHEPTREGGVANSES